MIRSAYELMDQRWVQTIEPGKELEELSGSPVQHCACWTTEAFGGSRNSYSRVSHCSLMSSTTIDPSRHKHGCLLQPSRSGISLLFPSFFFLIFIYICLLQKCNIIPQCCKEKHPCNAWNTLSPELLQLVGRRRTFFFGPNYFFVDLAA